MVRSQYFGDITIATWEYSLMVLYLVVLYLVFARRKNLMVEQHPEYRYFLWGLFAKVLGGVFFSLIYFYYYNGGDTISYYYSAVALGNLARQAPMDYLTVLFGENSMENRSYFSMETGWPYLYVYEDSRAYMVVRFISPFTLLTFNSYLISTMLLSSLSYWAIWKCYRTFVGYYPMLQRQLAIAILFMPSSLFWGSAILKDTYTFAATCLFVHAVDELFLRKRERISALVLLALATFLILAIKPYIFIALFPITLLWISFIRLSHIRNVLIKYLFLPAVTVGLIGLSFVVLTRLGDQLGKFSLDNALRTVVINQQDMKRAEEYGTNYFDLGDMEATWTSVLSKAPAATMATLFRPFIWECRSAVMVLSGLENLWLLALFLGTVLRGQIVLFLTVVLRNPLVFMCMAFALVYGFITGVSTPNFGALVRFKIPLIPFFVSGLFITRHILLRRKEIMARGGRFRIEEFQQGEPLARAGAS